MCLSIYELKTIKETVAQYDNIAEVYLFGSRTDDNARGGDIAVNQITDQFVALKSIINTIKPNSIFTNIANPVEWQKKIRDEWEAH